MFAGLLIGTSLFINSFNLTLGIQTQDIDEYFIVDRLYYGIIITYI